MKTRLLSLLAIFMFMPTAQSQSLSVGWEVWYPYQYYNKNNELVGLDIESFNAIMAEADLSFTSAEIPWKPHLHFIKTGKVDLAMGASRTEEREKYAYFTLPYRQETVNLFVKKGHAQSIKLDSLADIMGSAYLIGVEGGYYYGKVYQELIKRPEFQTHISEVIDLEQNVSLLLKGNLDGFLVDPMTMKTFIEKYHMPGKFEAHPIKIYSADIHIMLSKKTTNETLVNKINQSITTLTKNGTLQTINRNWSELHPSR